MKTDAIDRCIKDFTDCSNSHARLIGLQAMRELKAIEAEIELRKKSVENLVSLSGDEFIRWNEDGSYTIKRAIPPASPDKAQQMSCDGCVYELQASGTHPCDECLKCYPKKFYKPKPVAQEKLRELRCTICGTMAEFPCLLPNDARTVCPSCFDKMMAAPAASGKDGAK